MFVRFRTIKRRLLFAGMTFLALVFSTFYFFREEKILYRTATFINNKKNANIAGNGSSFSDTKIIAVGIDSDDLRNVNGVKTSLKSSAQTCRIPKLKKDRPEVARFYEKVAPLRCDAECGSNWLEIDEFGRIQPTDFAKTHIGVDRITCKWTFFQRVNDNDLRVGEPARFVMGAKVEHGDFFSTRCVAKRVGVRPMQKWRSLFATVTARRDRVERLKAIARPAAWSGLDVYVLGYDSVSQMEFRRNMPKTVEYLESVMKSSIFNGYNIVGDGTPQAYIPFLTGRTEVELPLTRKRYPNAHHVDDVYPFAWRNFSDAGYATLYGEDAHAVGTFTYRLKGFREQPTDHFPATFFHRFENYCSEQPTIKRQCCRRCVGDTTQHKMWLQYAESFWREYAEVPRFLLMHHSSLSHDSINDLQLADDELYEHLKRQFEGGAFNNAMVIVMADHGRRFSQMRETQQGQLEERLPFFSLYLPHKLANESPIFAAAAANVRANARDRLVSPFDMHATLMQLLNGWPIDATEFERIPVQQKARSLSLLGRIPVNRTCEDAGIEPHWCTCLQWRNALAAGAESINTAQMLAEAVVLVFNNQTEPVRNLCAPLKLKRLLSAKMLLPDESMLRYTGSKDIDGFKPIFGTKVPTTMIIYQLTLETEPGYAKYEATVNYDSGEKKTIVVDLKSVSHINAYGDQPHCIIDKNYFLAAYCVCYDKI